MSGWSSTCAALLLAGSTLGGCGQFGLPTGRESGEIQKGEPAILDIDPMVASQGTSDLIVTVLAIDTTFDLNTTVSLPLLDDVLISVVRVINVEQLELSLTIPGTAEIGSSPLQVVSERDGALVFEDGFTVVP